MKRVFLQQNQNRTVLELLRAQGEYLDAPCNGKGTCGKCCIIIEEIQKADPPKPREKEVFTEKELEEGWRLSCMTIPSGDMYVRIPEEGGEQMHVQTEFIRGKKEAGDGQGVSVWEKEDAGDRQPEFIEKKRTEDNRQISLALEMPSESVDTENSTYGIAIDIGTTTLAGELISLTDGKCINTAVCVNHQRAYGADVISRIRAAESGDAENLRQSILKDIKDLVGILLAGQKMDEQSTQSVSKIVIAGNTTMCHLLLGYSCAGLGIAPFTPVNLAPEKMTWSELTGECEDVKKGISIGEYGDGGNIRSTGEHGDVRNSGNIGINQCAEVYIVPGISAFVGGDITAGMIGCDMRPDQCEMLIDIGTNGEMVLSAGDHFLVSSVAAGPAFEGGNISCGVPGVPGAVCRAVLFGKENMVTKMIGGKPAIGLCGTGIIDVMYELVRHRIVDTHGTLKEPWFTKGFPVVPGKIYFTQEDIRQIQMAKAAICAGVEVLLQKAHIPYEQINRVYVAGGFGTGLDMEKAVGIGLLPSGLRGKLIPVGNSALEGAVCCLTGKKEKNGLKPEKITTLSNEINLADTEEFQKLYVKHMQFPFY